MFHDPAQFGFTHLLEGQWREIRAEYEAVRDRVVDWRGTRLYRDGWKVFGLHDFPDGRPLTENLALCPRTDAVLRQCFPRHGVVGFSVLRTGTEVLPHEGYPSPFLRLHLGLIVPEGDCGLRVGPEVRKWSEGKVLVFDDRVNHEAWNRTGSERVVLLVDFTPEDGG